MHALKEIWPLLRAEGITLGFVGLAGFAAELISRYFFGLPADEAEAFRVVGALVVGIVLYLWSSADEYLHEMISSPSVRETFYGSVMGRHPAVFRATSTITLALPMFALGVMLLRALFSSQLQDSAVVADPVARWTVWVWLGAHSLLALGGAVLGIYFTVKAVKKYAFTGEAWEILNPTERRLAALSMSVMVGVLIIFLYTGLKMFVTASSASP